MALLTPPQLRQHVETDLPDAALQRILDAEEAEIVRRYGAHATATELVAGGKRSLVLQRPAASVTSVTEVVAGWIGETSTVLAPDDYRLWFGNLMLERLGTGTNPRDRWGDRVTVVYVPQDRATQRTLVLVNVCKLAVSYSGVASQQIGGDYSEKQHDYVAERERLLKTLAGRWVFA